MITGLGDLEVGDDKDKNLIRMNVGDGRVGKRQSCTSFQEASGGSLEREERYICIQKGAQRSQVVAGGRGAVRARVWFVFSSGESPPSSFTPYLTSYLHNH